MQKEQNNQRYLEIRKVTVIGAVVDLVLGLAKIIFGFIGHSHGLVADGVHSLSDLATGVLVVWAARHGAQEADANAPSVTAAILPDALHCLVRSRQIR